MKIELSEKAESLIIAAGYDHPITESDILSIVNQLIKTNKKLQASMGVVEAAIKITRPCDWANYDKRVALVKAVDSFEVD